MCRVCDGFVTIEMILCSDIIVEYPIVPCPHGIVWVVIFVVAVDVGGETVEPRAPKKCVNRAEIWPCCLGRFLFSHLYVCLLYTSPSPRDRQKSRMPSSA